jgi:prophage regulatory protein
MDTVEERLLRIAEVSRMTGLERTSIWRRRRAGGFPEPVALGTTTCAWRLSEVLAWITSRPAAQPRKRPTAPVAA